MQCSVKEKVAVVEAMAEVANPAVVYLVAVQAKEPPAAAVAAAEVHQSLSLILKAIAIGSKHFTF